MKTQVTSRPYEAELTNPDLKLESVHATMKRDMFIKFFNLFKLNGKAILRMTDAELLEIEFFCEKSNFFCVHLEAGCREI